MKSIVLFRCHQQPSISRNHLELVKRFNPELKIYGMFGAFAEEEDVFSQFQKEFTGLAENVHDIKVPSKEWGWKNGDLAIRRWYQQVGHLFDFQRLYVIEWDLLLFGHLDKVYQHIPSDGLAMTGLTPLAEVEDKWQWTAREPYRREYLKLQKVTKKAFPSLGSTSASHGPGLALTKEFLEKYSAAEVVEFGNDELRLPMYAQGLGFKMYDTGFEKGWITKNEADLFNCFGQEIQWSAIETQLRISNGRRAFHPFRQLVDLNNAYIIALQKDLHG